MKTAYITGASAGLGRAIADAYARAGYKVGLIARDAEALSVAAQSIGPDAAFAAADVADYAQLEAAAASLERDIGPPGVWINDAMATVFSRFDDIGPEEFRRAVDVTLMGSVYGLRIALAMMKKRGKGHIIQIGSALAYRAIPLQAPYCASKLAVRGAVDSLRSELIHDKSPIRLTMVHMPAMNTPQFDWALRHIAEAPQPVPPIYAPEACAKAVLWTAGHPDRREVWVGLPTVQAIVANKLCPALMDYYMAKRAFEGQFEKPSSVHDKPGNLFRPVPGFHKAEGHFSDRQKNEVRWISTSWRRELAMLAAGLIILALLIAF
jgi:NADP-dependent 3-hydroxy acid dehydrogenase YdfG